MDADPVITLTTDFGMESPYVAAMKGVIFTVNPRARIIDLSHQIPPQDLTFAAFFLQESIPFFPSTAIHVVVVDPGVGTPRNLLYVELEGHRLLAPDNGVWTPLAGGRLKEARRLTEPRYWRPTISRTFHGRDILAPVAAHLSLGIHPDLLGPRVERWVELSWPEPRWERNRIEGEVLFVDHFGNLITNIPAEPVMSAASVRIQAGGVDIPDRVAAYGDKEAGSLVALTSSGGLLEVAEVQGNAARRLRLGRGTPVRVLLRSSG